MVEGIRVVGKHGTFELAMKRSKDNPKFPNMKFLDFIRFDDKYHYSTIMNAFLEEENDDEIDIKQALEKPNIFYIEGLIKGKKVHLYRYSHYSKEHNTMTRYYIYRNTKIHDNVVMTIMVNEYEKSIDFWLQYGKCAQTV